MDAVVYKSNTGFTEKYARLLGERTGLPVLSIEKSDRLPQGAQIVFLGWMMAGKVMGLKEAVRRFDVRAVCPVGMAVPNAEQYAAAKKACAAVGDLPLFVLQGGYDKKKLHGVYRVMMNVFSGFIEKQMSKKEQLTPEEKDSIDLLRNGGDRVAPEALDPVIRWLEGRA